MNVKFTFFDALDESESDLFMLLVKVKVIFLCFW